jgi:hypothetical protein
MLEIIFAGVNRGRHSYILGVTQLGNHLEFLRNVQLYIREETHVRVQVDFPLFLSNLK